MDDSKAHGLTSTQLLCVIPLESTDPEVLTVRKVTSLSADSAVRNHPDKIRRVSAKRIGMTLGDALDIAAGKAVKPVEAQTA